MDALRVRVYNVHFGDAILVSVPDKDEAGNAKTRHILIDVGNVQGGQGGVDTVFGPVLQDILKELNGQPLDLYVMTHEHLDHVQGLLSASSQFGGPDGLRAKLGTLHAWLTASSDPKYYDTHPQSKKQKGLFESAYEAIAGFLAASGVVRSAIVNMMMANNNPHSTGDCVDFLRTLAGANTHYVHREMDPAGLHPFRDATFELWAPEENTAIYYGPFLPMALGVSAGSGPNAQPTLITPAPPAGVDAGAFYDLIDSQRRSYLDNLLAIDKAANNTSIVFCLNWHGWRLLFPGDAEQRSWQQMNKIGKLAQVDFLKVAHHGSPTGTPPAEILNKVLPPDSPTNHYAAVSTYCDTYSGVPDDVSLKAIGARSTLHSSLELLQGAPPDCDPHAAPPAPTPGAHDGLYFEYAFAADSKQVTFAKA